MNHTLIKNWKDNNVLNVFKNRKNGISHNPRRKVKKTTAGPKGFAKSKVSERHQRQKRQDSK